MNCVNGTIEYFSKLNIYLSSYAGAGRRTTTPTTPKHSWSGSSSNNCKQSVDTGESLLLAPPNLMVPKGQQSDLTSYLSRRRNTTGSISINKVVDLKNTSSGNALKLAAAFSSSNNKLSNESKKKKIIFILKKNRFCFFQKRYFSNCGRFGFTCNETTYTNS
jgi:hypothetical protein